GLGFGAGRTTTLIRRGSLDDAAPFDGSADFDGSAAAPDGGGCCEGGVACTGGGAGGADGVCGCELCAVAIAPLNKPAANRMRAGELSIRKSPRRYHYIAQQNNVLIG